MKNIDMIKNLKNKLNKMEDPEQEAKKEFSKLMKKALKQKAHIKLSLTSEQIEVNLKGSPVALSFMLTEVMQKNEGFKKAMEIAMELQELEKNK